MDKICSYLRKINEIFDFEYDYNLDKGYNQPIHYSLFSTCSKIGILIYNFYEEFIKNVSEVNDIENLFKNLSIFKLKFKPVFNLFLYGTNIPYKETLALFVENSLVPIDLGNLIAKEDLIFTQAHFFEEYKDYLNFFKDEKGEWKSSLGFFIGISLTSKIILTESVFSSNFNKIIPKNLPFENFSQEIDGFHSIYSKFPEEENHTFSGTIQIFSTAQGSLPLYKLSKKKIYSYFENMHHIFNSEFQSNYDEIINPVNIPDNFISEFNDFINKLNQFEEKIILSKIFNYNALFSISSDDCIKGNTLFKVISSGSVEYNSTMEDKLEIVMLHTIFEPFERNFFDNNDIIKIDESNELFFKNNMEFSIPVFESCEDIKPIGCGFFIQLLTGGTLGDHTFWMGTFYLGSNYDSASEWQNFLELKRFYERHRDIEYRHYLVKNSEIMGLYEYSKSNPIISFNYPNPFSLFFNSEYEIKKEIVLNSYIETLNSFSKTFDNAQSSNEEKKNSLEKLSRIFFQISDEFSVIDTNVLTEAEEIDILVQIKSKNYHINDILGSIFIVECRNLKKPVSSKQIRDFGQKFKSKRIRAGIIISKEGITGNDQSQNAKLIIRDFANQGLTILVLDKTDLFLVAKGFDPIWIIKRAFCKMYFKGFPSTNEKSRRGC